jgi:hypothetical protein
LAGLVLLAGCAGESPIAPTDPTEETFPEAGLSRGVRHVTVLNQNVYPGANVDAVILALATPDPSDDLPALLAAVEELRITDAAARAGGLAEQIDRTRPDVIGLNEIHEIDVDLGPLGLPIVVHQHFLPLLQSELAARGLNYTVAASVQNIVAQPLPGVSYVDYDVMLVNPQRVEITNALAQNFSLNLGVVAPGVELKRGWTGIEGSVHGQKITIITAHPESGDPWTDLRAAQAAELIGSLGTASPVILMGDFNDIPGSPLYQVIAGGDMTDVWHARFPSRDGFTASDSYDLMVHFPGYSKRIDYIWTRGVGHRQAPFLGWIRRINDQPSDRVQGPDGKIYLSDHAGLVARFVFPAGIVD